MSKWIGIVTLTGAAFLLVGSALAQSQTPPAQTPAERDMRSESGSVRPLPPPSPPVPMVRRGKAANRANQDVQAPRDNQDVQAPRGNQDVQAPRGNQDVQAPRGNQDVQAPRGNQDVQAPRGNQDVQAPRGNQDVQAPRENQDAQAPRSIRSKNARDNQDVQSRRMSSMGNGQDVRAAQEALKSKGFDPGELDGRMGPHTKAAISEFQRSAGLRETGRFDQATRSQLGVGSSDTSDSSSPSQPANRPSGR